MENSIKETIQRIWYATFGNNSEIANYDPQEAADMLEKAGVFTPNDPNSPELLIEYRSNKSINTNDLIGILDDLEKDNKQCVFLILDYLKRIRSVEPHKEIRIELGRITDELCAIAKDKEIPILTASQLNRDAFRTLDEASTFEAKAAAADKLGSANIGESIDIVQNVDCAFIINRLQNPKYNEAGELEYADRYLNVKLIASRVKQPKFISFKHRFKDGYDLALEDDINLPTSHSIITTDELISIRVKGESRTIGKRHIV